MTRIEDRLREELPALADLMMGEPSAPPAEAEFAEPLGPAVGLELQPMHIRRRWPAVALAAAAVAAIAGIGVLALNAGDGNEVTTVESPSADTAAPPLTGASDGEGLAPEDGATVPLPQWTEIDPPFERAYGLESVGDGRILARILDDDGCRVDYDGCRVVVTHNGVDWVDVPIPDGIRPGIVDISGDRWLVTGREDTDDAGPFRDLVGQFLGERVFYSDDQGGTWVELILDLPSGATAVPYVHERSQVTAALVKGEQIVVVVSNATLLDLPTLLMDRDLLTGSEEITGLGWGGGRLTIDYLETADSDARTSVFAYEELDLTDDLVAALENRPLNDLIRIFSSDGSTPELVAEYQGWNRYGLVASSEFWLHVVGPSNLLLKSADGTDWTEIPMDRFDAYPPYPLAAASDGSIWGVVTVGGAASIVKSSGLLDEFETIAILEGVAVVGELDAGPAGLVATARAEDEPWTSGGSDVMVGWSADGGEWIWDTVGEAFGIKDGEPSPRLAVGEDFVLANVVIHEEPVEVTHITAPQVGVLTYGVSTGPSQSRWFIAEIPVG